MQPYKLASTSAQRLPYKYIEEPLDKFIDEVVRHHEKCFESYKQHMVIKLKNKEMAAIAHEINKKKRVINQLHDLIYEFDNLRLRVENYDLEKFDLKSMVFKKKLLKLIAGYEQMEMTSDKILTQISISREQISNENSLKQIKNYEEFPNVHEEFIDLCAIESKVSRHLVVKKSVFLEPPRNETLMNNIMRGPLSFIIALRISVQAALGGVFAGLTGRHYLTDTNKKQIEGNQAESRSVEI